MSEHTPSPQSVVVPVDEEGLRDAVEWLERAFPKDAVGFSTSYRPTMTAVQAVLSALAAAPAPSSLAGGEMVPNDLARIGYEAFNRSKKWEWASRGCQIGWIDAVTAILSALSPEAPARSVRKPDEMTENALRSRAKALLKLKGWRAGDKIHIHGMIELLTQFGMDVSESPEEDRCNHPECGCDFDEVCDAALTHCHEAPAEGAGRADVLATMRDHYQFALTGPWPDIKTPNYALAGLFKMAGDEIERLRARSSAPEAREGEAGCPNGHQPGCECDVAEEDVARSKPAAAAPSADKLRFKPTHRHWARGTTYEVIGEARLQQAGQFGPVEGDSITVYRGEDGQLWCRAQSEFEDGRFENLSTPDALKGDDK